MKLLDTDVCIHLLNAREPELLQRFKRHSPPELAVCSVVRAELLWGARNSARVAENVDRVREFCDPLRSLPFDDSCAECYGVIRADLTARGEPIGPNALMIASIAMAYRVTLVTRNQREFRRVKNLVLEVW